MIGFREVDSLSLEMPKGGYIANVCKCVCLMVIKNCYLALSNMIFLSTRF